MPFTLIAGGTGLVGKQLVRLLKEKNRSVRLLTRKPAGEEEFYWNPEKGEIDPSAFTDVETVVNLAGAGIAEKRWTPARKRLLIESRVKAASLIKSTIERLDVRPAVYVAASAVGYYGNSGDRLMRETDEPADNDFLAECCALWEAESRKMELLNIRTVILRIGTVLSLDGGALPEVARPLSFGLGVYFGNGKAPWSWIHLDDLCRIIEYAADNPSLHGTYNAAAPAPMPNGDFVKAVGKARGKVAIYFGVPEFALKLVLGEMAAVVCNGNRVSVQKIMDAGFQFKFPDLSSALKNLYP